MSNRIISQSVDIRDVTSVVLKDYGQLIIKQGDTEELVIEGQDQVIRQVKTQVRQGELLLDLEGGWFNKTWKAFSSAVEGKSLTYTLTIKSLDRVFVSGAARVKCNGLNFKSLKLKLKGAGEIIFNKLQGDKLVVELPGAGIISLAGKIIEQNVKLTGAGSYDAPRLESQICTTSLQGVGRATVWATIKLDATVEGLGSIDYFGNPDVRKSVSGLGKVSHRNH